MFQRVNHKGADQTVYTQTGLHLCCSRVAKSGIHLTMPITSFRCNLSLTIASIFVTKLTTRKYTRPCMASVFFVLYKYAQSVGC